MEKRLDLLIDNYESLKKVNASSWMGLIIHGCALEYTLKDKNKYKSSKREYGNYKRKHLYIL
ncbi:hypothetical protein [Paraclostridium sp. AKS81]|uniref:hypothetical protein n=1 Tax=Paraclostridium sp. AKS81 TaxID=2876117 RepID=UPI0021DF8948|nr:hypothetical protein [Paraclostridium sp. AKS81]MCU9811422.1 hypothetical protein [Paraclostridium sp. AKS81]